jgi:hypothetical protein
MGTLEDEEPHLSGGRKLHVHPDAGAGSGRHVDRAELGARGVMAHGGAHEAPVGDVADGLDVARSEVDPPHEEQRLLRARTLADLGDEPVYGFSALVRGAFRASKNVPGEVADVSPLSLQPLIPRVVERKQDWCGNRQQRRDGNDGNGHRFSHRVNRAPLVDRYAKSISPRRARRAGALNVLRCWRSMGRTRATRLAREHT